MYRPGYLRRYAKVTINEDKSLGHRELIAGDVNEDGEINDTDISIINSNKSGYGGSMYNSRYDLNGDGNVDSNDVGLVLLFFNLRTTAYEDTYEWLISY